MKGPIQSVEVAYLAHATEDHEKLAAAVAGLLGVESGQEVERLEGHFGNEILMTRIHLTGEDAERAFRSIIRRVPGKLREELLADIGSFMDEHSALFLRLDKQSVVSGFVAFGSADAVRVKVKPRGFMLKEGAAEFYSRVIRDA